MGVAVADVHGTASVRAARLATLLIITVGGVPTMRIELLTPMDTCAPAPVRGVHALRGPTPRFFQRGKDRSSQNFASASPTLAHIRGNVPVPVQVGTDHAA